MRTKNETQRRRENAERRGENLEIKLEPPRYLDLIVEDKVIVDLKAKEDITPLDRAKLLSYLRLCNLRLRLIINVHSIVLKDGVFRMVDGLRLPEPGSFSM